MDIAIVVAVFYAGCGLVAGLVWLVGKLRKREMIELRGPDGESVMMSKAQYARYCYALGTKNPDLIRKVVLENQTRRGQLKAQSRWTKPLIVTLTLACASAAHAQAPSTWAGLAEYRIGEQYYEDGDYQNALASLQSAWKALPLPVILYDLALTHYQLDNVYVAREYLRAFMRTSHAAKYPREVNMLAKKLIAAIDEDYQAMGLEFACDMKLRVCGIAHWSPSVLEAWNNEYLKELKFMREYGK
ncbi:MAG TPA: hypothetical protein VIG47_08330 [Gemmatimonadaceae bacterium]|jgi:tetratricopeptide (TPR) repeat protein